VSCLSLSCCPSEGPSLSVLGTAGCDKDVAWGRAFGCLSLAGWGRPDAWGKEADAAFGKLTGVLAAALTCEDTDKPVALGTAATRFTVGLVCVAAGVARAQGAGKIAVCGRAAGCDGAVALGRAAGCDGAVALGRAAGCGGRTDGGMAGVCDRAGAMGKACAGRAKPCVEAGFAAEIVACEAHPPGTLWAGALAVTMSITSGRLLKQIHA